MTFLIIPNKLVLQFEAFGHIKWCWSTNSARRASFLWQTFRHWMFRSFVFCSTSMHIFCAREVSRFRPQVCVPLCWKIPMDNNQTTYWSMIKRLDLVGSRVFLLCAPGFGWVVLREDFAHRVPFGSKRNCSLPRVERQVEGQLVCTRTVRSRTNVRTDVSSLALLYCFSEEQVQYRRSWRRRLELVFPLARSVQRYS